jgi:hypothetical protein
MYETDPSAFPSRVDEMTKYLVAATCWMAANLRPFNKGPVTRMVQGTRLWLPG